MREVKGDKIKIILRSWRTKIISAYVKEFELRKNNTKFIIIGWIRYTKIKI